MRTRKHETKAKARADSATIANLTVLFIIALVMAGATMLINDVPELRRGLPENAWPPSAIARALTVPIAMTGMTDCRWYVIPIGVALLLVLIAARPRLMIEAVRVWGSHETSAWILLSQWWFESLGLLTIGIALLSAWTHDSWEFSRGWVYGLVGSTLWCVLLSRIISRRLRNLALIVVLSVVGLASLLTIWHRAAMGEPFIELPIGPVTVIGEFGAVGIGAGAAWVLSRVVSRGCRFGFQELLRWIPALSCGSIGLILVIIASRRGSWVAAFFSVSVAGAVALSVRLKRKAAIGCAVLASTILIAGAAYVQQRYVTPRSTRIPMLGSRTLYWQFILAELPSHLLLGSGPDTFVCGMTTANALKHSTQPKFYTGRVDYDAHNEWLQAFHELGVIGGLSYLAMPLLTILLAIRKWRRQAPEARDDCLLACAGGLFAVVVYESASINLRHPILSPFYWTLLGLTLNRIRQVFSPDLHNLEPESKRCSGMEQRSPSAWVKPMISLCAIVAAFLTSSLVYTDLARGMAHESAKLCQIDEPAKALQEFGLAIQRIGSRNWFTSRCDRAMLLSRVLVSSHRESSGNFDELSRETVNAWQEIFDRCRGYPDAGYKLAEALLARGDRSRADSILREYLAHVDPYDAQANILRIYMGGQGAMENLLCLRSALFRSPMNSVFASLAARDLASSDVSDTWASAVHKAWESSKVSDDHDWLDALAPETLRIEALRLAGEGELQQAARVSLVAAEMYGRQVEDLSDIRRVNAPVADAWYVASRFLFESEPTQFQVAFAMIQKAEAFAELEIKAAREGMEKSLDLDPICLRNRTPELRQLLRFSAMMGMASGMSEIDISRRVNWSLPGDRHTIEEVTAEKASLAAELTAVFDRLPPEIRPAVMSKLQELARRATPQSQRGD